jgi:hypothetical protein
VKRSYTLESSFLGRHGNFYTPAGLEELGEAFCRALFRHDQGSDELLAAILAGGARGLEGCLARMSRERQLSLIHAQGADLQPPCDAPDLSALAEALAEETTAGSSIVESRLLGLVKRGEADGRIEEEEGGSDADEESGSDSDPSGE